uniref:Uncharacterized protein n=1 Tax=Arundo donax TaxID=35708 RepID=A0A0A8YKG2_ARUDO
MPGISMPLGCRFVQSFCFRLVQAFFLFTGLKYFRIGC